MLCWSAPERMVAAELHEGNMVSGTSLYIAGAIAGVAAYIVGRTLVRLRDIHRNAVTNERTDNVVRLLRPYAPEPEIDLTLQAASEEEPRRSHLHAL